jgi:glycosyltransferase involved in cell wall biosynthesis
MASKPLVSVIVIFLNAERFLSEAVESVFAQTYDSWELMLVDDGSTDGSPEMARRYAERDSRRIRYLSHPNHQNRGMSPSRNLGLSHAKGDFIAFLDSDDVWFPQKLESQVAIMLAQPKAGIIYGSSQYWYSWTNDKADVLRDRTPSLGVGLEKLFAPPTLLTLSLQSVARTPCPSDFMIRREVVGDVGGFEEQAPNLFEDQIFLAKVFLKSHVFVSEQCWDRYRQHPDSCVSIGARDGRKHSVGVVYFDWLEKYLLAKGVRDPELWSALRKKRFRYRHAGVYSALRAGQQRVNQINGRILRFVRRILSVSVLGSP